VRHPWPHLAIAFLWLACTTAGAYAILCLAEVDPGPAWLATCAAIVLGWLPMAFVRAVARWRDRAYATPVPSQPPA
jgi:hypothetical protein